MSSVCCMVLNHDYIHDIIYVKLDRLPNLEPWCSGYHVCLTRSMSPVRSWPASYIFHTACPLGYLVLHRRIGLHALTVCIHVPRTTLSCFAGSVFMNLLFAKYDTATLWDKVCMWTGANHVVTDASYIRCWALCKPWTYGDLIHIYTSCWAMYVWGLELTKQWVYVKRVSASAAAAHTFLSSHASAA